MADPKLSEDDEFEIIETEALPDPAAEEKPAADPAPAPAEADDDDEDEDARLAESEDESEDEITAGKNREKRAKRRELQKRAKEAAQRELEFLRQQNAQMMQRLSAVEGHAIQTNEQQLEARWQQAQYEAQQAELIMARAADAGNGEDMVAAMRIRDQAKQAADQLAYAKQQLAQAREQAARPQVDPRVVNYAQEWTQANPWYDPNGGNEDSRITAAIDAGLLREGYNPADRGYWEELTRRVAARMGGGAAEPAAAPRDAAGRPQRQAPPTGNSREHAPASTRKQVHVTPERKAAMIEAGIWDDPVRRNQMLKAYQEYDRQGSAR